MKYFVTHQLLGRDDRKPLLPPDDGSWVLHTCYQHQTRFVAVWQLEEQPAKPVALAAALTSALREATERVGFPYSDDADPADIVGALGILAYGFAVSVPDLPSCSSCGDEPATWSNDHRIGRAVCLCCCDGRGCIKALNARDVEDGGWVELPYATALRAYLSAGAEYL